MIHEGFEVPAVPESVYTSESDWCPCPGNWHAFDEQATELEVIEGITGLIRMMQPELVVECGTHVGLMAQAMGTALRVNGHGELYTYEIEPGFYKTALMKCQGLPVHLFNLPSEQAKFPDGTTIDFAWIDGKINRDEDFLHLHQWMRPGTIVGFHDTAPHHEYIRDRVYDLERVGLIETLTFRTPRGLTLAAVAG